MSELPIVERLVGPMPICPFDSLDCKVKENEPCPVCGDVNEFEAVSNCMSGRDKNTRQKAAELIAELVAALDEAVGLRVKLYRNSDPEGDTDNLSDAQVAKLDRFASKWSAALARARSKGE